MNNGILAMVSLLLVVAGMIGTAESSGGGKGKALKTTKKAGELLCQASLDKDHCMESLGSVTEVANPGQVVRSSFQVSKQALIVAIRESDTIKAAKNDPRSAQGLEICKEVMTYALNDIEKSVNSTGKLDNANDIHQFMEDLKVWMGGALTYQDVCYDAFEGAQDTEPGQKMRMFFNTSSQLTSAALAAINKAQELMGHVNKASSGSLFHHRLLGGKPSGANSQTQAGELPPWMKATQRNLLVQPVASIKPDAVVAQDGSGQFKTVTEALTKNPNDITKPYIVYVKAGIYKESVTIDKNKNNIVLIGDGPTKTIITERKNFVDGVPTFKTSTVSILGDGFMARDIGFENSAGAEKHQAVALRVVGDYAVFFNCLFDGFQDTLYPVRGRQFYRDCTIKGTIDFIFGDAQAIFQNCQVVVKKPMEGQKCAVTAQGRTDPNGPGALILQNCNIVGDPALTAANRAYLGRPWKPFARTIIMQSSIESIIAPEGWEPWSPTSPTDQLFYAEFQNRGPGSALDKRVKWVGVKKLTPDTAKQFTPDAFYNGGAWVPPTGAPYAPGMIAGL